MALPVAAIICIVLACWVIVILLLFALYKFLKSRGTCNCDCKLCGEEGGGCCECCISLSDACNCCNPSVNGCRDKVCPGNKKISCADIILCQCCAQPGEEPCCLKVFPCCSDDCECCDSDCCACCADCDGVVCCCLEIRLVSRSERQDLPSAAAIYTMKSPSGRLPSQQSFESDRSSSSVRSKLSDSTTVETETLDTARSVSQLVLINKSDVPEQRSRQKRKTVGSRASQEEVISNTKRLKQTVSDKDKISPSRSLPPRQVEAISSNIKSNSSDKASLSRTLPLPPRALPLKPKIESKESSGAMKKHKVKKEEAEELVEVPVGEQTVPLHTYSHQSATSTWQHGTLQGVKYQWQPGVSTNTSELEMAAVSIQLYPQSGYDTSRNSTQNSRANARDSGITSPVSSDSETPRRPLPVPRNS